ncbi:DNA polymerase III beta subunit [Xanthomonas phage XAJ2]|uniref:DNA polymerase III beta subunit n=1 Tax=Xanthomonas phage XAJ2 TaxID=1775249 RepID=A0A1I9L2F7_9CAUD|nr:DNA polymerase III beta subunit [Xanthomonas phage XAJ2]
MAGKKPTGRKPTRSAAEPRGADKLIAALKFIAPAQKKAGLHYQTHCVFYGGNVIAFDGLLTIGHPIEEDIHCCPESLKLLESLNKCGQELNITQLDSGRLSIKSGRFKAIVNCHPFNEMPYVGPDQLCAVIDDRIKEAFSAIGQIISESADRIVCACICLRANTAVATNGFVLAEYWHGIDLPDNLLIPKLAVKAICAATKKLVGFGFSTHSATFFFEDGSYIKTQLFDEGYPRVENFFIKPTLPVALPEDFFKGIDALDGFDEDNVVYFSERGMSTARDGSKGATYEIEGLPNETAFSIDFLKLVQKEFLNVDFQTKEQRAYFFGKNSRGVIMGRSLR